MYGVFYAYFRKLILFCIVVWDDFIFKFLDWEFFLISEELLAFDAMIFAVYDNLGCSEIVLDMTWLIVAFCVASDKLFMLLKGLGLKGILGLSSSKIYCIGRAED